MPPQENLEIYSLLFSLETVLRELIIESLSEAIGSKWYKSRLPVDVKTKYIDGLKYEKSIRWNLLVPHHPIYYIDFPDLRKIIEREDNWKDAFSAIFGRKDLIVATLTEIEFIRNKIAHNRRCSRHDVEIFVAAHTKVFEAIGVQRAEALVNRLTVATDIYERVRQLSNDATRYIRICTKFEILNVLTSWEMLSTEWWFDESYLNHPLQGVVDYFNLIEEYTKLERGRGQGHLVEAWVKSKDLESKYEIARDQLNTILNSER